MDIEALYRESRIWDDHGGFEMIPDAPLDPLLAPWRQAGVDYLSINVSYDPQPWFQAIENIASIRRRLPVEAPYCQIVGTLEEVESARAAGQMAVTFDIEGMNALNCRIDLVQFYYDIGVRHMLFAYNRNNLAGAGCHGEDIGLTDFGRAVVEEMNRVGMVIDCSHSGLETTMEAIERSADPVIFSHSNPRALVDHDRNITDTQIKACAESGGVVGINGVNLFLGENEASPGALVRHIAYVAELAGAAHVGISLDYAPDLDAKEEVGGGNALLEMFAKYPDYWPEGAGYDGEVSCLDVRHLPEVASELAQAGFNRAEIAGILGGNFRRVAAQVWK